MSGDRIHSSTPQPDPGLTGSNDAAHGRFRPCATDGGPIGPVGVRNTGPANAHLRMLIDYHRYISDQREADRRAFRRVSAVMFGLLAVLLALTLWVIDVYGVPVTAWGQLG